MEGTNLNMAVPLLVSCAVPRRWMSVQYVADASQKFTCPVFTDTPPLTTVAVSVNSIPEETDVTTLPPEVTVNVVDVDSCAGVFSSVVPLDATQLPFPICGT